MPLHDTLWKRLLQILFASVLRFLAPSLAGGAFSFLDKELFPEGIRGEGREVDVLGRVCLPAGGTVLVHLEVESRYREESVRRLRQYYHLLEARHGEPVFSVLIALRGALPKWIGAIPKKTGALDRVPLDRVPVTSLSPGNNPSRFPVLDTATGSGLSPLVRTWALTGR